METITPARFDLRRNVTRANADQTKLLKAAFAQSNHPSAKVIEELSVQTGLYVKWIESWFYRSRKKLQKTTTQGSNVPSNVKIAAFKSEYQDQKLPLGTDEKPHTAKPPPINTRLPKLAPSQGPTIKPEPEVEGILPYRPTNEHYINQPLSHHEAALSLQTPGFTDPYASAFSCEPNGQTPSASDFSSNQVLIGHGMSNFSVPLRHPQHYQPPIASSAPTFYKDPGYNHRPNAAAVTDKYPGNTRPPLLDTYNAQADGLQTSPYSPAYTRSFARPYSQLENPSPFYLPRTAHAMQPLPHHDVVTHSPYESSQTIKNSFPYYQYSHTRQHNPSSGFSVPFPVIERKFAGPSIVRPNARPILQTPIAEDTFRSQQLFPSAQTAPQMLTNRNPFRPITQAYELPRETTTLPALLHPQHLNPAAGSLDRLTTPLQHLTVLRDTYDFDTDMILSRLLDKDLIENDPFQAAMGLVFLSRLGLEWDPSS